MIKETLITKIETESESKEEECRKKVSARRQT